MFKHKSTGNPENVDTLIGSNTVFEGSIESQGTVRIDGRVKGDLKVSGDVFVGSEAVIAGNITANNVHLSGTVEGNIHAAGVLRILSTAKLYGDIQVHSFVADEGGIFQGKCSMLDVVEPEKPLGRMFSRKSNSSREYKKSSVLNEVYEEKEKNSNDRVEK